MTTVPERMAEIGGVRERLTRAWAAMSDAHDDDETALLIALCGGRSS